MEKKEKKYTVDYCSGATGYGWSQQYDRLDEFESFINEMRKVSTAHVTVWDSQLKDFIFWKDCLCYEPRIDMLRPDKHFRDLRTKDRKWHSKEVM